MFRCMPPQTRLVILWAWVAAGAFLIAAESSAQAIPKERVDWWRSNAFLCKSADGFQFPSKSVGGECDDGDMNLFAGLLCAAGEPIGCETVRRSQDAKGRWFRSPARKENSNQGQPNSFSPDMALGTQLYLAKTRDRAALANWLDWLDDARPCWIGAGDSCMRAPFLRFCTDDTEKGCTVRPGDAAILHSTVSRLGVVPKNKDIERLLSQFGERVFDLVWASSQFNQPGYSQHLVGVEVFLLRSLGFSDPRLDGAAFALSTKQPRNPFFLYLKDGPTPQVAALTLELCPSPSTGVPGARFQWAWEREDAESAWRNSMFWDCIFMARLLGGQ